jgi:hypothetical protein
MTNVMPTHHVMRCYAVTVRTTVTLDPDTELVVRELMKARGVSFKQAINDAIRAGRNGRVDVSFSTREAALGTPTADLDRALAVAGELEDAEIVRKMQRGS